MEEEPPQWRPVKEEEPDNTVANARGRVLHYLGRGGASSSRTYTLPADSAAAEQARWNAAR